APAGRDDFHVLDGERRKALQPVAIVLRRRRRNNGARQDALKHVSTMHGCPPRTHIVQTPLYNRGAIGPPSVSASDSLYKAPKVSFTSDFAQTASHSRLTSSKSLPWAFSASIKPNSM